jgi:hypothetical protein
LDRVTALRYNWRDNSYFVKIYWRKKFVCEVNEPIVPDQLTEDTLVKSAMWKEKKYSPSRTGAYVQRNMESPEKYCEGGSVLRVSGTLAAGSSENFALNGRITPRASFCRSPSMRDADASSPPGVRLSDLETFVLCQNIERYSKLMTETMNTDKRLTLERLLAEERSKLLTRCPVVISGTGD